MTGKFLGYENDVPVFADEPLAPYRDVGAEMDEAAAYAETARQVPTPHPDQARVEGLIERLKTQLAAYDAAVEWHSLSMHNVSREAAQHTAAATLANVARALLAELDATELLSAAWEIARDALARSALQQPDEGTPK